MIDLIREELASYKASNQLEEEYAVKEILQDIALYGLWRAGFFDVAAFQGGTSLRILYGMSRFSEDLDFILKKSDPGFAWSPYLEKMIACFAEFGLNSDVLDKGRMDQRVKKALIKDSSICNQLNLSFFRGNSARNQKIKLEIDVDPPDHSLFEYRYLDFPLDFEVCHQDLSSNFALKIHALLCRPYVKGRDWYDFNWYIKQDVPPNLPHLQSALFQWGPWKGRKVSVDLKWLKQALAEKIVQINWQDVMSDVERFLGPQEQHGLKLWNNEFFLHKVEKLQSESHE